MQHAADDFLRDRIAYVFGADDARGGGDCNADSCGLDIDFRRGNIDHGRCDVDDRGGFMVLHAHIWPRYAWEPDDLVWRPVWLYPPEKWRDPSSALGPQNYALRAAITANLKRA